MSHILRSHLSTRKSIIPIFQANVIRSSNNSTGERYGQILWSPQSVAEEAASFHMHTNTCLLFLPGAPGVQDLDLAGYGTLTHQHAMSADGFHRSECELCCGWECPQGPWRGGAGRRGARRRPTESWGPWTGASRRTRSGGVGTATSVRCE